MQDLNHVFGSRKQASAEREGKSKKGSTDAVCVVRCLIELAWETQDGKPICLALDWAKAFDTVAPSSLCKALVRFGVPVQMCNVIGVVYSNRQFRVGDEERLSSERQQHFGISQWCPLSPFLFSIMMTVLLSDASRDLAQHDCQNLPRALVNDLVYADDTLVLAVDSWKAEIQVISTGRAGANYGLCFSWKQVEAMLVRCDVTISKPDGTFVPCKSSMMYLGNVISASGEIAAEVSRRLGAAKADFRAMERIWKHSSLILPDPPCQPRVRSVCSTLASRRKSCTVCIQLGSTKAI